MNLERRHMTKKCRAPKSWKKHKPRRKATEQIICPAGEPTAAEAAEAAEVAAVATEALQAGLEEAEA